MRVIMFQPQFHQAIRDGVKTATIRKAARCQVGDELSLRAWSGKPYRSKHQILGTATCQKVRKIWLSPAHLDYGGTLGEWIPEKKMDGLYDFARREGFRSFGELIEWFDRVHGLPFEGEQITWDSFSQEGESHE